MGIKKLTVANLRKIQSSFGSFDVVVDVGCGERIYEKYISAERYIGVDVEVSGRKKSSKIPDIFYDGVNLPFDDDSIDFILCTEVLEHAMHPEDLIKEFFRCLKPSGLAFITVPSMWGEHEMPYDFRRYTSEGIKKLVSDADFRILCFEREEPGVKALIKLGLSEIQNSENNLVSAQVMRIWLYVTLALTKILNLKMSRIYLSNQILIRK